MAMQTHQTSRQEAYRSTLREGMSKEQFLEFLGCAERDGWRSALASFSSRGMIKDGYVVNDGRADWRFLLPLDDTCTILDAGCGWGTMAFPLAEDGGLVLAMDAVPERLRFIELRTRQDRIRNVVPVRGALPDICLSNASCDVAVLNGVVEWLGLSDPTSTPEETQVAALREVARVLRPGGLLYVGIENRFGARYLLGAREDHTKLRFVGVVPRRLGDCISRWRRARPLQVRTLSRRALSQLLWDAGFANQTFFTPLPDYKVLRAMVTTGSAGPIRHYFGSMRLATGQSSMRRMLAWAWPRVPARCQAWFADSFSVIARKSG